MERRRVVAVGVDYGKVRHREPVEADIPDVAVENSHADAVEDSRAAAVKDSRAAAVEGSLGAVEGDIVLAVDSLEEGRRSPVVVEEDNGPGEVVGSPLMMLVIVHI